MEQHFTEEISLQGEPEEIEERFAQIMENLPRMYEITNAIRKEDPLGYPNKIVLEFERKYN